MRRRVPGMKEHRACFRREAYSQLQECRRWDKRRRRNNGTGINKAPEKKGWEESWGKTLKNKVKTFWDFGPSSISGRP